MINSLYFSAPTQIVSLAVSLFSLSLTASTFLLYQHEEYLTIDPETLQENRGINNPKLMFVIPVTFLYVLLNIPRLFANGLLLSISPLLACIMLLVELAIMIQVFAMPSHEIDGRIVELRRATSQVGVSVLSSGFL